jgi:hypothetical protein
LSGTAHTSDSYDHADLNDNTLGQEEMTVEYLRGITLPSLPLGSLKLRIGAPLMLMRNLDPQHGLCNGTRMTLLRASRHCLDVRLNGGQFDGQCRLIYRCSLSTSEDLAFHLTRTQFPVRLAFAMTINKNHLTTWGLIYNVRSSHTVSYTSLCREPPTIYPLTFSRSSKPALYRSIPHFPTTDFPHVTFARCHMQLPRPSLQLWTAFYRPPPPPGLPSSMTR